MSQKGPAGRMKPRWSVAGGGQGLCVTASIAGLPGCRACVCVRPPLFCSGPSSGLVLLRSPGPARPHVLSLLRLSPWDVSRTIPAQFPPAVLLATIVFLTVSGIARALKIPPPVGAPLPLRVTLVNVALLLFAMPPPLADAVLLLSVLLVAATVPCTSLKMPPPLTAELLLSVTFVRIAPIAWPPTEL
jgi:hypothetical protein